MKWAGSAKLSLAQIQSIPAMHDAGLTVAEIAKTLGVSNSTVHGYLSDDAQRKARARFFDGGKDKDKDKDKGGDGYYRSFTLRFRREADAAVIAHLQAQSNMQDYIRRLIQRDIDAVFYGGKDGR